MTVEEKKRLEEARKAAMKPKVEAKEEVAEVKTEKKKER